MYSRKICHYFCGSFGRTDQNVYRVTGNVDSRNLKFKFHCLYIFEIRNTHVMGMSLHICEWYFRRYHFSVMIEVYME